MSDESTARHGRPGWVARVVGRIGAWVIYALLYLFGRAYRRKDIEWLVGPIGGATIGDAPYRDVAKAEGLTVERMARVGGLVPSFQVLACDGFEPARTHPLIREFYERTTEFAMDVWSRTYFPMNIGLWLLVTTISRQVNQLNFPLSPLDTAHGMSSEIITMRKPDGTVRYTGWFRQLASQQRVLYTGFYMTERAPHEPGPCVKVVFPMPNGNATVVLRPAVEADGSFTLDSSGRRFGEAGFYRVMARGAEHLRVWHVKALREQFRVYVDREGTLRCDHSVKFLGMPVLRLHYKIFRRAATQSDAAVQVAAS